MSYIFIVLYGLSPCVIGVPMKLLRQPIDIIGIAYSLWLMYAIYIANPSQLFHVTLCRRSRNFNSPPSAYQEHMIITYNEYLSGLSVSWH